MLNWPVPQNFT
jgi:hypothetical protein